jgi:hypothetical protein
LLSQVWAEVSGSREIRCSQEEERERRTNRKPSLGEKAKKLVKGMQQEEAAFK